MNSLQTRRTLSTPISSLTNDYEHGYRSIHYEDLANAINGAAWWLSWTLCPPKKQEHEVLVYMGPNDLRYKVLILAAVKVRDALFLPSPRNSIAAQTEM